jgi:hypothetical protein
MFKLHKKAKAKNMDTIIGITPSTTPMPPFSSGKLTLHSLVEQHVVLQDFPWYGSQSSGWV